MIDTLLRIGLYMMIIFSIIRYILKLYDIESVLNGYFESVKTLNLFTIGFDLTFGWLIIITAVKYDIINKLISSGNVAVAVYIVILSFLVVILTLLTPLSIIGMVSTSSEEESVTKFVIKEYILGLIAIIVNIYVIKVILSLL